MHGVELNSMLNAVSSYIRKHSRGIVPALWLFLASLGTLALAAYPMYVIRPFREQTPAALDRALWVLLHYKPLLLILALAITALALLVWRDARWIARLFLAPAVTFVLLAASFSMDQSLRAHVPPLRRTALCCSPTGLSRCWRHGYRSHSRRRESSLSDSRDGISPRGE